jgi:hypothetical protein
VHFVLPTYLKFLKDMVGAGGMDYSVQHHQH